MCVGSRDIVIIGIVLYWERRGCTRLILIGGFVGLFITDILYLGFYHAYLLMLHVFGFLWDVIMTIQNRSVNEINEIRDN